MSEHDSDIDGLYDIEETEAIAEAPLGYPDQIADKYWEQQDATDANNEEISGSLMFASKIPINTSPFPE